MGFLKGRRSAAVLVFTILFLSFTADFGAAIRPRGLTEQLFKKMVPNFESLPRGPVPPSAGSPCTNIPGGAGLCTVKEINAAGASFVRRRPFPLTL
ncbi:hypothetical protein ERO13_D02G043150v2 [Gossypium hirsutum]|uniref:Cupin type-1 domain-containing protein n=7 Tax=Gossypium TaxID=3633 RepID=A0A5J5S8M4_GOSBA|nr:hypothetical protein ES319_D02G048800v1 [Gossypium barbadense]KAG4157134.1 hypothetical protein ERO13_D02G043150v2 [Gossypium hirsutum]TYG78371.1 hypothetical protein ES288_D02G053500v1 [Gossypium darwinii]TYH82411.1 hypothetical protein ES332_D02G058100v1 [Gossypium tomentosum]